MKIDAFLDRSLRVRKVAILGNVSVGKTSLFDQLCENGEHAVNIPGSTLRASRGVLAVGAGAAPRALRKRCASCGRYPGRAGAQLPSCASATGKAGRCPPAGGGLLSRWIPGGLSGAALRGAEPLDRSHLAAPALAATITHLFDTPGSAMLGGGSEDEMVARDLLLSGQMDAVLLVADSKNVRRALAFALQVAEFRLPMVVALNMIDEAESIGVELDSAGLTRALGVPVGRTVAVEGVGVRRLAELLLDAQVPQIGVNFPEAIEEGLARLEPLLANPAIRPRALGLLLLSSDKAADDWVGAHLGESVRAQVRLIVEDVSARFAMPLGALVVDAYHSAAARLAEKVVTSSPRGATLLTRFGELAQRPVSGTLIAAAVLLLSYLWVGSFGATYVVDKVSAKLFGELLIPLTARVIAPIPSAFVRDAILDPNFGLLPTGLSLAVGTVLPVLFCFYLLQAVLEDSGYLPRLAVLSDRLFRGIGLNGQGLIPLVLGFSCTTMAMITARILPSRRERIILTLLLIGVPCAPLLAVMLVVLGRMSWVAGAAVLVVVMTRIIVAGLAASRVLPGDRPDLILELPRMRIPKTRVLLAKTLRRSGHFLREAVPVFLAAAFAVFLFDRVGGLAYVEALGKPVAQLMGLPDHSMQVFIKTAIRREAGAAELSRMHAQFTPVQLVITLLVMTLSMPCINTTIVMIKERGLKVAVGALAASLAFAVVLGAIVNLVLRAVGIA